MVQCILLLITLIAAGCAGKKEVRTEEFDAERSLARANELTEKKEFDEARKVLLEVKNRDLTRRFAPLAMLKMADSYAKEEEYEAAVEEYRRFLELYPDHKNASYAQYQIGMIYFMQIEGPERGYGAAARALEEFEKLKKMYPRNPYREMVELRIEKCRNTMAEYEFLVAEFYFKKGSCNAALLRYQQLLSQFPEFKKEPLVLYNMAVCSRKLGKGEKAIGYLNRLIEKYPGDKIIKDAKKELASLGK